MVFYYRLVFISMVVYAGGSKRRYGYARRNTHDFYKYSSFSYQLCGIRREFG